MSPESHRSPDRNYFRVSATTGALRGKLLSGKSSPGKEVHAASLIRQRRIVLDAELKKKPMELKRILIHELFHFAWLRLGNPGRRSFEELLRAEVRERVRGELGWSAEHLKLALTRRDCVDRHGAGGSMSARVFAIRRRGCSAGSGGMRSSRCLSGFAARAGGLV